MTEENKVVSVDNSIEGIIKAAVQNNISAETLEKLLAIRTAEELKLAKACFVQAVADFQKDCPSIEKTKKVMNKDGRTVRYQYAPLDVIISQIRAALAKHGLSYRWETENENGRMKAIAIVTHTDGHSEQSSFEIPIDTEGYMTAPQKVASALTFAKRYSLCNVLGISTGEEDDDATTVRKEKEPMDKKAKIMFRVKQLDLPQSKEEIKEAIKKATALELVEKNFDEIIARLDVLIEERNSDHENNTIR